MVKNKLINQTYGVLLNKVSDGKIEFADIDFPNVSDMNSFFEQAVDYFSEKKDYENLSKSYASLNMYKESKNVCDILIKKEPKNGEHYHNRGFALNRLEKHKSAIVNFNKSIKFGVDNAYVRYYRGCSNAMLDNYEEAINDFGKALDFGFDDSPDELGIRSDVYFSAATVFSKVDKYHKAIECIDNAIELEQSVRNHTFRGKINAISGAREKALKDIENAIDVSTERFEDCLDIGELEVFVGSNDSAKDHLEKFIKLVVPNDLDHLKWFIKLATPDMVYLNDCVLFAYKFCAGEDIKNGNFGGAQDSLSEARKLFNGDSIINFYSGVCDLAKNGYRTVDYFKDAKRFGFEDTNVDMYIDNFDNCKNGKSLGFGESRKNHKDTETERSKWVKPFVEYVDRIQDHLIKTVFDKK